MKVGEDFGRIIFHTENVDRLYSYMKHDENISKSVMLENEPTNAAVGERFFHIANQVASIIICTAIVVNGSLI